MRGKSGTSGVVGLHPDLPICGCRRQVADGRSGAGIDDTGAACFALLAAPVTVQAPSSALGRIRSWMGDRFRRDRARKTGAFGGRTRSALCVGCVGCLARPVDGQAVEQGHAADDADGLRTRPFPAQTEASAADTSAALKAIDATARAKGSGHGVGSRDGGQMRIAVVSRVNRRWPISL